MAKTGGKEAVDSAMFQPEKTRAQSAEELARRAQKGCQESFAALVERYGGRLFLFLRHRTGNVEDAEDLVQDTFVRAYQSIGRYSSSSKFSTWLFTIAVRLASSHYRRMRRTHVVADFEPSAEGPAEATERREARQSLWALAASLPEGQYQALWLRYVEDMPVRQIAKVLRKSQVYVRVLLCRARVNLSRKLAGTISQARPAHRKEGTHIVSFARTGGKQCSAGSSD
jgi:RNA polymerase sigma-70 factor (ECF subfamily)